MSKKKIIRVILVLLLFILAALLIILKYLIINLDKDRNVFYTEITEENTILEDVSQYIGDIDFETINIPKEVLKYIKNKDEFDTSIKKFLYRNGLIDASTATLEEYEINKENSYIQMFFKLNNTEEKIIVVLLDYKENAIEILDFWGYDGDE